MNFRFAIVVSLWVVSLITPAAAMAANIAPLASVQASSENASRGQLAIRAVDTIIAGSPGDPTREWATDRELTGAWITLSWPQPYRIDRIVLYDRPNLTDRIRRGTLSFSDGSAISVGALANNGSGDTFIFPAKTVTWVKLSITRAVGTSTGLAEFEVYGSPILPPEPPLANFSAAPLSGTAPLSVAFTDTSTGGVSGWQWDFGDSTASTQQNPVHTYTAAGTYAVSLTATGPAGTDTRIQPALISVEPAPPSVAITAPASGAAFMAPATIPITAIASATTGATVESVHFFAGSESVGTALSNPYTVTWNNVAPGDYALKAELTDSVNAKTASVPVGIRVYDSILPAGWNSQDIGTTGIAGSTGYFAGAFSVSGSGADIWGRTDAFRFAYRTLVGDGQIVARVMSLQNTNRLAKGGVMIRQTLAANSPNVLMALTPGNGATFQRRRYTGATSVQTAGPATATAPYWVKLVRSGNTFTGYISPDGEAWTQVGRDTVTMGSTVYVGLALTSHNNTVLGNSTLEKVAINGTAVAIPPSVSITAPEDGALFSAPATITITATAASDAGASVKKVEFFNGTTLLGEATAAPYSYIWNDAAAGSHALTARVTDSLGATATSTSITVSVVTPPTISLTAPASGTSFTAPATIVITAAAAADAGATVSKVQFFNGTTLLGEDTAPPYSYTWMDVATGSYSLTAKVTDSLGATTTSTPVTVSVTGPPTISIIAPTNGASFNAPATVVITAAAAAGNGATISKVQFYNGTTLLGEAATEPYSFTWTGVAAGSYTLTARITDSQDRTATSLPVTVAVASSILPAPWETQDIGSVGIKGNVAYMDGTFTVSSSGLDIWGTADAFRFVYQQLAGDGQIISRIVTMGNTDPWAKGGVMIRETLTANSPHALMAITPGNGAAFQRRPAARGISSHTAGPMVTAPYWVKLVRNGDTFSGYVSPDGTDWQLVGTESIAMTGTIFIGLAVTGNNDTVLCQSTFDNVQLAGNLPGYGIVQVTAPSNAASFIAPAAIQITARPAPSLGAQIAQIEFFNGDLLLGISTAAPYSYTWNNVAPGSYSLTAKMTDSAGLTATSDPVAITVTEGTLPSPWATSDVGSVGVAGRTGYFDGTFSLFGSGIDIWNAADSFRFVYQPLAGDGQITARVAFLQETYPWAKAGVMIRATLAANSPHALMAITPSNGAAFQRRLTVRASSLHTAGPKVSAPYWVRLVRNGNIISGYASPDGVSWELVGTDTVAMATTVYVGLALTSCDNSVLGSSSIDAVEVTSVPLPLAPEAGSILLEENFDDTQLSSRGWFDGGATTPQAIVSDPERGNVLELTFATGATTPGNGGAMRRMFAEADDIIISFQIRYQDDWQWPNLGYGPHEFYLLTNLETDTLTGMARTFLTTYIEAVDGKPGIIFQDARNIDQNNIGVSLSGITESRGVMGCNGTSDEYPAGTCYGSTGAKNNGKSWIEPILPSINNGAWRSVKVRLKMNTIADGKGIADGILQYWLDDVPYISHRDVMIRTGENPNAKWNEFIIAPYFGEGSPQMQKFWIDDLKITTAVIPEQELIE